MTATAPPHTLQTYMVMRHPIDSPMAPETEAKPPPMYTPDAKRPILHPPKIEDEKGFDAHDLRTNE